MTDVEPSDVLESLLLSRYSCRAFTAEAVDTATVERMFSMAQRAASWCNAQPWQVLVTRGTGTERFRDAMTRAASERSPVMDVPGPDEYRGVYRDRRRETGLAMYGRLGIERGDVEARRRQEMENFRFFGAPHVAVLTSDRSLGAYGQVDVGGFVATLLLAAESLGVAAVPQAAIAMYSDVVREHFELADDRVVVLGVSFGLADADHPVNHFRTSRAELGDAVGWVDQ